MLAPFHRDAGAPGSLQHSATHGVVVGALDERRIGSFGRRRNVQLYVFTVLGCVCKGQTQ